MNKKELLEEIVNNKELLEVARAAIEDELISLRDSRIAMVGRNNGLVVKEYDGSASSLIRLDPEMAMATGLRAIAEELGKEVVVMTQEERDCLDGDMFAYISDPVSRYIAEICGKLGVGRCTCSAISDIVRKKNGHPLYGDLKRIRELEGK